MRKIDVIVIGAGASGLMCAAQAGQRGRHVLVLDASNKVGKKILMSGGGRCNFTNLDITPKHFLSSNPHFCISALKRYTQWDFITLVEKYKIPYEERKHGQLFCLNSAKDILQMLLQECQNVGCKIQTHCSVTQIKALPESALPYRFQVSSNQGDFQAQSLVIASGGLSIPSMGASGFGYDVARQFGHTIVSTRAGLVPFTFSDGFKATSEALSGIAVDITLSCEAASFSEAVLFTHRGLSGPATLQVSSYWQTGEPVSLDFFPAQTLDAFIEDLKAIKNSHAKNVLRTVLTEHLPKSLVLELQTAIWPTFADTPIAQIPDAALAQIAQHLKAWSQKPSGTEGYRTAEVTLGGIDTREMSSKTMESQKQAGLYFIGEVVDVSGHLGGYNFQWAWSSGAAAAAFV